MRVLVVLVNYRTAALTLRAVDSLVPELRALPGSRLVVVDNESGDGSYAILDAGLAARRLGDLVELMPSGKNGGYGYGNNVAIRQYLAQPEPPEYVWVLNPDTFVTPGSLRALHDHMETHPHTGIAGARIVDPSGRPQTSVFAFPSLWSELESSARLGFLSRLRPRRVIAQPTPTTTRDDMDWTSGTSMFLRVSMLDHLGLFDERFFLYFEEVDLCLRARRAGYRVAFVHEATIEHVEGASTEIGNTQRRTPTYLFDSRRYYFLKHHGRAGLWAANILRLVGLASFRLRVRFTGRPDPDFAQALGDLWRHCVANP